MTDKEKLKNKKWLITMVSGVLINGVSFIIKKASEVTMNKMRLVTIQIKGGEE